MPYIFEPMSEADQERVFRDADERKRRQLSMRGGHFSREPDLEWAIDRPNDSYLLRAPTLVPTTMDVYFYFRFRGGMYSLKLRAGFGPEVSIEDPVEQDVRPALIAAATQAFVAHTLWGAPFTPVVS